jgi:hypothetical protein
MQLNVVCALNFSLFFFQLLFALGFLAVACCVIVGIVVYYAGVAGLEKVY